MKNKKRNRAYSLTATNGDSRGCIYFLTLHANDQGCLLASGETPDGSGEPIHTLTDIGQCVQDAIDYLEMQTEQLFVGQSVIMPNHVHLMLCFPDGGEEMFGPCGGQDALSRFVASLMQLSSRICGQDLWRRDFSGYGLEDDEKFLRYWEHIETDPACWSEDEYCTYAAVRSKLLWHCQACGESLARFANQGDFCSHCGQKTDYDLKWSKRFLNRVIPFGKHSPLRVEG